MFLSFVFSILNSYLVSVSGRLLLIFGSLLALFITVARGEGKYQSTRDGKTLVWNSDQRPGDVATWSGDRDREGYAHGFGQLVWYIKESGSDKPELYARYWGRMVNGKLEGPVNVHSKGQTRHAIFIDGSRVSGWTSGTASSSATARWNMMVADRRANAGPEPAPAEEVRRGEPESPAAGPRVERAAVVAQGSAVPQEDEDQVPQVASSISQTNESIHDLYKERWPKIDIDDSLRLLVFPPRTLRSL